MNILKDRIVSLVVALIFLGTLTPVSAQEPATESKPAATQDEEKQEADKKADEETEEKAEEPAPEPIAISVSENNIHFTATGTWKSVPLKSNMLESELQIPKVGDDEKDGRLTIMGAGGSVEANIVRWQGQFVQPDGTATADRTKQEKKEIDGQTVHLVDISGTFLDSPGGPFGGQAKVERENYRMLAAIIETETYGKYFVKLYGPKATIDKNAEYFKSFINSLKVAE